MGYGLFPVFEPHLPDALPSYDGKQLLGELELLDEIAARAGMATLSSFAARADAPEDFDGDPDALRKTEEWFDPTAGADAIERLADLIESNETTAGQLDEPERTARELRELARVVRLGAQAGARFRLDAL